MKIPMHPYRHFSHCWQCRRRIFERYLPEVNRRGLVGRRAQLALFKKIHVELLAQVDDTPECLPLQPASQQSTNSTQGERDLWSAVIELSIHDLASRFDAGASRSRARPRSRPRQNLQTQTRRYPPPRRPDRQQRPPPRGQKSDKFKSVYAFKIHRDKRNPLCDLDFSSLLSLSTERLQDRVELNDADPVNHFLGTS